MKKIVLVLMAVIFAVSVSACANNSTPSSSSQESKSEASQESSSEASSEASKDASASSEEERTYKTSDGKMLTLDEYIKYLEDKGKEIKENTVYEEESSTAE